MGGAYLVYGYYTDGIDCKVNSKSWAVIKYLWLKGRDLLT